MKALVKTEFFKLFTSLRTYLTFAIAIVLMVIINFGLYIEGESILAFLLQPLKEYFLVQGNILNGYLIAYFSLNTLWVHIPVLIIIVTAYIYSGEFENGTIKLLLSQPISRGRIMWAKFMTMVSYNLLFMVVLALFALIPAVMIFGRGDIMVLNNGVQFLLESSFFWRYGLAVLFAMIAMTAFSSLSMYAALYFKDTLTAILVSFGVLILHTLFQSFTFEVTSTWQNLLFSYHMSNWQLLFMTEVPWRQFGLSALFLTGFTAIFTVLSYNRFKRMNIA
ncbi:ABC transporter permease [Winogradskyella aurantiaca]|uniref:ABC transporter permease n=1 Tax=Winogradskyella aurantiaca TaxID=2219558 RepID=UPI000E1CAB98|nr:ABC transporter permease [Winogradskyella aurantiaca]